MIVIIITLCVPITVLCLKYGIESVGISLIGSEYSEVLSFFVKFEDISYELSELDHILTFALAMSLSIKCIIPEIGKSEVSEKKSAVSVRVSADSGISYGSKRSDILECSSVLVEELFRLV